MLTRSHDVVRLYTQPQIAATVLKAATAIQRAWRAHRTFASYSALSAAHMYILAAAAHARRSYGYLIVPAGVHMALAGRIAAFVGGQYSTNDKLYAHSVSSRGWRYVRSRVPLAVQRRAACTIQVTRTYYHSSVMRSMHFLVAVLTFSCAMVHHTADTAVNRLLSCCWQAHYDENGTCVVVCSSYYPVLRPCHWPVLTQATAPFNADTYMLVLCCHYQRAFTKVRLHNTAVRRVATVRTARDDAWAWDTHQRITLALHVQVHAVCMHTIC
jgi:hypothetical protein